MTLFIGKKTGFDAEVGTQKSVRIWKFWLPSFSFSFSLWYVQTLSVTWRPIWALSGLSVGKVNNICEKLDLFRKVVLHILILHCDCEALILQNRRRSFEYFSHNEYKHFNYMLICRVWQWNQTFGKSPNMVNQKKYSFPKWHKCDQQPNQGQTKQFLHLKNHLWGITYYNRNLNFRLYPSNSSCE